MRLASIALVLVVLAPSLAAARTPTWPQPLPRTGSPWDGLNLLLTRERLHEIKQAYQTNDPLAVAAVNDAIATADGYLGATPDPVVGVLKVPGYYTKKQAEQQTLTARVRGDARAAIALAWGYALTGDDEYADAAKKFLDAWVRSCTKPVDGEGPAGFDRIVAVILGETGGDTALVVRYGFPGFLYAYDILNGFGKLSFDEKAAFKKWLAPFVLYKLGEERFHNNHHNWHVLFLGAAAHVTEDANLFETAVAYFRNGFTHQQIAADGAMWRELARKEKAATYSLMALEAMVQFVTIAKHHGVNLRDLVCAKRKSTSGDSFLLSWVTGFHSSGVASAGGDLRAAFGAIRDFVNDGSAWTRWRNTINKDMKDVNGPTDASDWGWVFEVGYAWFQDPSFLPLMQKAPYGLQPERAYTTSYATLLFRPFAGAVAGPAVTTPAPAPAPVSAMGVARPR